MTTPRTSAPLSAAIAMIWASAPGLPPSSAESGFQPCTKRRYVNVAAVMHRMASDRTAMLSG